MVTTRNQERRKRSVGDDGQDQQRKRVKLTNPQQQGGELPVTPIRNSKLSPRRKRMPPNFTAARSQDDKTGGGMTVENRQQREKFEHVDDTSLLESTTSAQPRAFFASMLQAPVSDTEVGHNSTHQHAPLWNPDQIPPPLSVNQLPPPITTPIWDGFMIRERANNIYLRDMTTDALRLEYIGKLYTELAQVMVNIEHEYWYHMRPLSENPAQNIGIWNGPDAAQMQAGFLARVHQMIRLRSDKIHGAYYELCPLVILEDLERMELHEAVLTVEAHELNLQDHFRWVLDKEDIVTKEHGQIFTDAGTQSPPHQTTQDGPSERQEDIQEEQDEDSSKTTEEIDAELANALDECKEFDAGLRFAVTALGNFRTIPYPEDVKQAVQGWSQAYREEGYEIAKDEIRELLEGPPAGFVKMGVEQAADEFISSGKITCDRKREVDGKIAEIERTIANQLVDQLIQEERITGPREKEVRDFLEKYKYLPQFPTVNDGKQQEEYLKTYKDTLRDQMKEAFERDYRGTMQLLQRGIDLAGGWNTMTPEQYTPGEPEKDSKSVLGLIRIIGDVFLRVAGSYLFCALDVLTNTTLLIRVAAVAWCICAVFQLCFAPHTAIDDPHWIGLGPSINTFLNNPFLRRLNFPPDEATHTFLVWALQHVLIFISNLWTQTYLRLFLFFLSSHQLSLISYTLIRNSFLIGPDAWLSGSATRTYAFATCVAFSLGLSSFLFSTTLDWTNALQWAGILSLAIAAFGFTGVWGEAMGRAFQDGATDLEEVRRMDAENTFDPRYLENVDDKNLDKQEVDPKWIERRRARVEFERAKKREEMRIRRRWEVYMRFMFAGLAIGLMIGACAALSWYGLFGGENVFIRFLRGIFQLFLLSWDAVAAFWRHWCYVFTEVWYILGGAYIRLARLLGLPYVGRGGATGDFAGWVEGWWRGADIEVLARGTLLDQEPDAEAVLEVERFLVGRF
ncbi:hypothetical protein BJ508DRAFT_27750 [Ascobolus immersus RN42]|uniref:Uncharacterized protein n=1 Tax=Ascobolus immersus RN42 TaxID=1160509 RepID=A0A3N4IKX8_ASCIM|nr:hypothetical protein BJ508DRAFT_27750 [Ascobolus immersus RN42]